MKHTVKFRNPLQPLYRDEHGTTWFKTNKIVRFILDSKEPQDMNTLAMMEFSDDDREQFAQLIGYSLSGFSELSYVSDETFKRASRQKIVKKPKDWSRH